MLNDHINTHVKLRRFSHNNPTRLFCTGEDRGQKRKRPADDEGEDDDDDDDDDD